MFLERGRYFFSTITVNNWISVFEDFPTVNSIVLGSFNYLTENRLVEINAFVIMKDHIHLIWTLNDECLINEIILKFKKYTGRRIVNALEHLDPNYLNQYFASARKDRKHKFWKTNDSSLELIHRDILFQKIEYIHSNPTTGAYTTCNCPIEYYYSSARAYHNGENDFPFLTPIP